MKKLLYACAILMVLAVIAFTFYLYPRLPIINGYAAKMACSCTFLSGRSLESVQEHELSILPFKTSITIDPNNKNCTSHFLGLKKQTAVYKENLGCVIIQEDDDYNVHFNLTKNESKTKINQDSLVINDELQDAITYSFDEGEELIKKTRTLVVLHKGKVIAERYVKGFDRDTPILGWSMCKIICNALVGILVKQGKADVTDLTDIPEWEHDERKTISIHNLLQMQSGLEWEEVYTSIADPTRMFYIEENAPKYAYSKMLERTPGTHWIYSSGTTNILSFWLRRQFESHQDYLIFPYKELFEPLGIQSATLETDEAGNYVLSSYAHMTTRDWAKLGQLYLDDGIWNGKRILPEDWVNYSTTPAEHAENGVYGAHFWLNTQQEKYPNVPTDMYYFAGFQGQRVFIIPSEELVIARTGLADESSFDMNKMIQMIISSVN